MFHKHNLGQVFDKAIDRRFLLPVTTAASALGAVTTGEEAVGIAAAAECGGRGAHHLLAVIGQDGSAGCPSGDKLAARWLEKADLPGNARAREQLTHLYESGQGFHKNLALVADWHDRRKTVVTSMSDLT